AWPWCSRSPRSRPPPCRSPGGCSSWPTRSHPPPTRSSSSRGRFRPASSRRPTSTGRGLPPASSSRASAWRAVRACCARAAYTSPSRTSSRSRRSSSSAYRPTRSFACGGGGVNDRGAPALRATPPSSRSRARVQLRGTPQPTRRAWTEDREAQRRPRRRPTPRSGRFDRRPDERRELAATVHLAHDVAAADQLAAHVELRDGRPARVHLDRLALLGLREHVDGLERDSDRGQDLHRGGREAAHREARGPLHVEDHPVLPDLALDLVEHVGHRRLSL